MVRTILVLFLILLLKLIKYKLPIHQGFTKKLTSGDFPGGAVVKNLPANARDMGSSLGPGRSHMLQSN